VEDDPALCENGRRVAPSAGLRGDDSLHGMSALGVVEQHRQGPIDLLFTDVVMPQLNGKELSERIQASHPETKILFTSAYTANAIMHQEVLSPGAAILQKPFTPSALACKVREVLDQ